MFCMQCGAKLEKASNFCGNCGTKVFKGTDQDVEVPFPSSIDGSLSQGAKESLAMLKEKYGRTGTKVLRATNRACESKDLLIHVMDKNKRALKRAFPSDNGLTGCVKIKTNYKENGWDWIQALKTHFRGNFEFVLHVMDRMGLEPISSDCDLKKLESSKFQKKAGLKVYAMAKGKERQEIVEKIKKQKVQEVVESGEDLPEITFSKASPKPDRKKTTSTVSTAQSDDVVESGEDLPEITFSKPSPKPDRKKTTSTVSTAQSDDVVESGEDLPEITFSKPSPKPDRKKTTSTVSTAQSDDVVESGEDLPEITFSKPSPKPDRKKTTSTVSTAQCDDFLDEGFELPDLQNVHVPLTMSKSMPAYFCAAEDKAPENEVMDKEIENFFNVMEMKRQRKEMADQAEILFPNEGKEITIVYYNHGGMSFTRRFSVDDTMQSVFNYICQAVEPEILPPVFHLECPSPESCQSEHCQHMYELGNSYGMNVAIIPTVLILKEENYNMDDTLTNYGNVFFKDI